jgi:hypothetical protein
MTKRGLLFLTLLLVAGGAWNVVTGRPADVRAGIVALVSGGLLGLFLVVTELWGATFFPRNRN